MSTSSAIPKEVQAQYEAQKENQQNHGSQQQAETTPSLPSSTRLHFNNLSSPYNSIFTKHISDPYNLLTTAYHTIIAELYPSSCSSSRFKITPSPPQISSLTLVFDDSNGVAYTIGIGPQGKDKEIHFSLSYLNHCSRLPDPAHEIRGVITHELVHCYQHTKPPNSNISGPPGGLIEGIADYVRLKASLAPSHWRRPTRSVEAGGKWDAGYQFTAYFLDWLDDFRLGSGAVAAVNHRLFTHGYTDGFWEAVCGAPIEKLWEEYRMWLDMHHHDN